jgi:AsmA protein
LKRFIIFICGLLVVLALVVAAVPFFLTTDFVADKLKTTVKEQTGRTLVLNGPLRFKFWPNFMVEANDVTLSNPPDMFKGQFAAIETLRVKVSALALLSRKVDIQEMTLVSPRLSLIVDGAGKTNWSFSSGKNTTPRGKSAKRRSSTQDVGIEQLKLAPVVIKNGDVRYLDERTGTAFAGQKVNLTITLGGLSGPVDIRGNLVWNKEKIELALFSKSPTELASRGSPLDLSITSKPLEFQFNGLARLADGITLAGTIKTKTPSIRKLAAWAANPLTPGKGLGPFAAKAKIDLRGKTIKLSKARVALDGMNGQGNLSISLAGARPRITANIGVDQINVNTYMIEAGGAKKPSQKTSKDWSDAPIDLSGLKALDANLSIATSQIVFGKVIIGATKLSVVLAAGKLNAKLGQMAFYDGKASGQVVLSGAAKVPTIQGTLRASGLNAFRLLRDFAQFKRLEGTGQLEMSLAGRGASQRQLVSSLAGTAQMKFTNGAIKGINVAAMVRNVQKSILGGWDKKDNRNTDFSEFSMLFEIKNGIATNQNLKLLGPLVRVTGNGKIDLPKQRLDYRVKPKLVATLKGQGGAEKLKGIAVPIVIKGPWDNPKIYPDIEGILSNPKAAFSKLSKLLKGKTGIDLKKAKNKIEQKALKKVEKVLGDKVDKKDAVKKGKNLLKGLLGSKKKPATQ